jgi:type VI secretion system secreted protein Hcp
MKKSFYSHFFVILLSITFGALQVAAQNEPVIAYVTAQSNKMGQIKGTATTMGKQNAIECIGFSYAVQSPVDQASGMLAGKRQHSPIVIVKHIDIASPLLFQAAVTNDVLKTVTIELVRKGIDGKMMIFETITLSNAAVSKVNQYGGTSSPEKLQPNSNPFEEISFTFQKIEITNNEAKTTGMDSWSIGR